MIYKAKFYFDQYSVFFYIELHGSYNDCWQTAQTLAKKLDAEFTGILEEMK